jgi:hypothetical protein
MTKRNILIIICLLFGIALFFIIRIEYLNIKESNSTFNPQTIHTKLQPPKDAIQATVTNIEGTVKKQKRNDDNFKPINKPTSLVQGESISTGQNGSSYITFRKTIDLTIENNTQLDFLNGLPKAIVVRQPNGTITYYAYNITQPFSIRSLGLLIQINKTKTKVTINTNSQKETVSVTVKNGEATLAYSDSKDKTQVKKIKQNQSAIFDYNQSTLNFQ